MRQHLLISIRITLALLVITCGVYPALIWAIGQTLFRDQANGSLIVRDGKVVGSALIGQDFTGARYFHPRPSGSTNWGPTSKKLRDALAERTMKYTDTRPAGGIPADAVTASCSGVDPHISPQNAAAQAARVASANRLPLARVQQMIAARTEGRFLGIFGEPRVNVLLLNLDLRDVTK